MPGGRREGERSAICAVTVPVLPGAAGAGLDSTRARLQRRVHPCPRQGHPDVLRGASETRSGAPRRPAAAEDELDRLAGQTITADGLGGTRRCELFERGPRPGLPLDRPPALPLASSRARRREAAALSTSSSAPRRSTAARGSRAPGAVYAENQALRWIADLAGLPASAGGVFVPGGTIGNLSALVAARHTARARAAGRPARAPGRGGSPRPQARTRRSPPPADVMDAELVGVPRRRELAPDRCPTCAKAARGERPRDVLRRRRHERHHELRHHRRPRLGRRGLPRVRHLVPRRRGLRRRRRSRHPRCAHLFDGIEHADSFIVDPHKWLFAPFDCCALIYRDPALARAAHTQQARLPRRPHRGRRVEPHRLLRRPDPPGPRAAALVLARRPRHRRLHRGRRAHPRGRRASRRPRSRRRDYLELVREPDLSVVVFRRLGWTPEDYQAWSDRLLRRGVRVRRAHDRTTARR